MIPELYLLTRPAVHLYQTSTYTTVLAAMGSIVSEERLKFEAYLRLCRYRARLANRHAFYGPEVHNISMVVGSERRSARTRERAKRLNKSIGGGDGGG